MSAEQWPVLPVRAGQLLVESVSSKPKITRADPTIWIGDGFMRQLRAGGFDPAGLSLDGDVLTVADAFGARFVYRVTGVRDVFGSWFAEWPD